MIQGIYFSLSVGSLGLLRGHAFLSTDDLGSMLTKYPETLFPNNYRLYLILIDLWPLKLELLKLGAEGHMA